jgi:haloalkane dehalogenase
VVVQDWGGPIGLRWAVENPDRVARLVILNTGLFTGRVSKGFMAWRDFAERNPDLPVGFVIDGATSSELSPEVRAAYEAPFPTPESKAGAAQFPLLVPTSDEDTGAAEMRAVADELSRWERPALVPGAGDQVAIEGAAHFLQEDRGAEIGARVAEFIASGR